jgi:DNA-binding transcriptional LysR family regulator
METLANLEAFARSAETGSFSAAARLLGLTPAAVSRNVATLERNLGVRLFQRSTRKLTLTEAGEGFLESIGGSLHSLQAAIAAVATERGQPAGVLKLSVSPSFGASYLLPLLPAFVERYPSIRPDWQLENRRTNLVAEGVDVAIGGGIEHGPLVVARQLAPAHVIAVAAPAFLKGRRLPRDPSGLVNLPGIALRSEWTGRLRSWTLKKASGEEVPGEPEPKVVLNDPSAMCQAAALGLGVALLAVPDVLAQLESGRLVRILPRWYADAGTISLYYASRALLPAKTRAFVEFVTEAFAEQRLAQRFRGDTG